MTPRERQEERGENRGRCADYPKEKKGKGESRLERERGKCRGESWKEKKRERLIYGKGGRGKENEER